MVWWIHKIISAQGIVIYIEIKNDSPAIQEGTAEGVPFASLLKNAQGLAMWGCCQAFQAEICARTRHAPINHRQCSQRSDFQVERHSSNSLLSLHPYTFFSLLPFTTPSGDTYSSFLLPSIRIPLLEEIAVCAVEGPWGPSPLWKLLILSLLIPRHLECGHMIQTSPNQKTHLRCQLRVSDTKKEGLPEASITLRGWTK